MCVLSVAYPGGEQWHVGLGMPVAYGGKCDLEVATSIAKHLKFVLFSKVGWVHVLEMCRPC